MLKKSALALIAVATLSLTACGESSSGGDTINTTPKADSKPTATDTAKPTDGATTSPSEKPATEVKLPGKRKADAPVVAADLKIVVLKAEGESAVFELKCKPAGGTVKDADAKCKTLAEYAPGVFEPTPKDMMCTQQIAGPEKAKITGTFGGKKINAEYNLTNGCEISRWGVVEFLTGIRGGEAAGS